jgi:hypothetical protein
MYGVPWSINTANYVYFLALQRANKLNNETAANAFLGESL